MKTEDVVIDGKTFTVRELSLREGLKYMNMKTEEVDLPSLLEHSVTVGGQPVKEGELTMGEGIALLPVVMRLNRLGAANGNAEGNG